MASNKNMLITEKGLNTLSRELLNRRKFQKRLIDIVGKPTVVDGIALSVSDENYFKHSNLEFASTDKVSISFKGSFVEPDENIKGQILWSLSGLDVEPLSLVMFKDKISIYKGDTKSLGDIVKDSFTTGNSINVKVTLEKNKFIVTYTYDNKYNIVSGQLLELAPLEKYTDIAIGSAKPFDHWLGNIDLNDFIIDKNKETYYAPSTEASFHFTKVLVSNGNIPLTDLSTPLINNIYEFEISEIKRTGNNLLLLARIDSDVYLDIKEVGLYSYTNEGPMLFSKIAGLSIKKQKELGYGLLFNVNTELGVVNTVALPEILVHSQDVTNQRDFTNVKRVHTCITIDMERIINMNACSLGYGRTQKIESSYAKISSWVNDNSNTQNFLKSNENVQNFLKVNDKIGSSEERTFNIDKIEVKGALDVTGTGVTSNFSDTNYALVNYIESNDSSWKYSASFKLNEFNTAQTVLNAYGRTVIDPLVIGIEKDNTCYVQVGKREKLNVYNSILNISVDYLRHSYRDILSEDPTNNLYAWTSKTGSDYTNSHIIPKGKVFNRNGIIKDFSGVNYAVSPVVWDLGNSFEIELSFSKSVDPVINEQVLLSADKDFVFQISMDFDKKLMYKVGNGVSWIGEGKGLTEIQTDEEKKIEVTFDGTSYKVEFIMDNVETKLDWSFDSPEVIPAFTAIFGQKFDHSGAWEGYVNLLESSTFSEKVNWSGASSSNLIFTKEISPTSSSKLYDLEMYEFNNVAVARVTSGLLLRESLFKVSRLVDYYISVEYKNGFYEIYIKEGNLAKRLVYRKKEDERMNPVSSIFLGIDKNKNNYLQGTMYLLDMDFITGDRDYSPVDKVIKEKNLKDFFYITEYPYSSFKAINLKSPENSYIQVLEGSLTGNKDNIDFDNYKGFTLCVKMFLKDGADEVILAKVNDVGTRYFVLKYENKALTFTLYQKEGRVELKKQYTVSTFRQITDYPSTIFITYNGDPYRTSLKMYKNNTLLDEFSEPMLGFLNARDFFITNYLDPQSPSEVNDVINILSFEGELTEDEIFLINNLLDTNF